MPRLFHVARDEDGWGDRFRYDIRARHPHALPGFRCPECGEVWATVGAAFPAVDISGQPWARRVVSDLVELDEFLELRTLVLPFLPAGEEPQPGWELGPLSGRASGRFGDFAWDRWYPLLRRGRAEELRAAGVRLPEGVAPRLVFSGKSAPSDLLELQVEPLVDLAPESFAPGAADPCPRCGRVRRKLLEPVITGSSIPAGVDLFRPRVWSAFVIGTERLVEEVRRLGLTDVTFKELPVA
ncbi:MAG TPA: double-CXXCG motif protein [Longimicrobium sp.]|jgi:uncharacterized double-CXXCG motif protein